jgi:hypothetical protein
MAASLDVQLREEEVGTPTVLHFVTAESSETPAGSIPDFTLWVARTFGRFDVEVKTGREPPEFARRQLVKAMSLVERSERVRAGMVLLGIKKTEAGRTIVVYDSGWDEEVTALDAEREVLQRAKDDLAHIKGFLEGANLPNMSRDINTLRLDVGAIRQDVAVLSTKMAALESYGKWILGLFLALLMTVMGILLKLVGTPK